MNCTAPRILIAGTHSGCGKTTVASGIMAALTARGLTVQPFKVGPDFIDPSHHTAICGRASRNLDPYMMGEDGLLETFGRACEGADIAVIEGVMGMYDGLDGTDMASSAHVARILSAPVVLVVDVKAMSRSANALIRGYRDFDPSVDLRGVILNRVGSARHRAMIEESLTLPAFGWIPRQEQISVAGRHLGLRMAHETRQMEECGPLIREHCDLDGIITLAGSAPPLGISQAGGTGEGAGGVRIGVAQDPAFCFYYQDNLDRLAGQGASLVFFSPMEDRLPDIDALYIGGGYPELHADALAAGVCRHEIRQAVDDGLPVYAECGGLVYLTRSIAAGREYPMVAVLPADAVQTERICALGYVDGQVTGDNRIFPISLAFRGHEFHYSRLECSSDARFVADLSRGAGIMDGRDGLSEHAVVAGYTHAYFTDRFAGSLVRAGRNYSRT